MTKDEALRMSIEALIHHTQQTRPLEYTNLAIQACKDALAETQEPVSYHPTSQEQSVMHQAMIRSSKLVHKATPPSREWVGLSDEEIDKIYCEVSDNCVKYFPSELYAAWFKALKEKNNGT